ncbi:hypothetical protein [Alkaliphilus metalliredigens]|nr:hypothetical protein [Alkaliphilus metalliredigens]
MNINILTIVLIPLYFAIPALILYFVIKLAVKNAIKELKEDKTL